MDPEALIELSSMDLFTQSMEEAGAQVEMLSVGWDQMSLLDRAAELDRIGDVWAGVLQNVTQTLAQIDAAQQQIGYSWDRFIEGLTLGGMSERQQTDYWVDEYERAMAGLEGAGSLEDVQFWNSEIARILQSLAGVVDLDLMDPAGNTWRDTLIEWAERASVEADERLETLRNTVLDQYADLTQAIRDTILAFGELPDVLGDFWRDSHAHAARCAHYIRVDLGTPHHAERGSILRRGHGDQPRRL